MNDPRNVLTSAERHEQLKAIAAALGGLSIAETLGHLINAEIARGTIPDTIPGVTIKRVPDGVYIALDPRHPGPSHVGRRAEAGRTGARSGGPDEAQRDHRH